MKNLVIIALLLLPAVAYGNGTTEIYLANDAAGNADGTNCSNARDYTWFNSSGNWGGGTTDIDAGDTVHVCDMITPAPKTQVFTFQGSGSSGNEITLYFEEDAGITSSVIQAGVSLNSADYVVVDGGTNGIIKNTDNGSPEHGYAFASTAHGVVCDISVAGNPANLGSTCNNVTIKNLTMLNIYARTYSDDNVPSPYNASGVYIQKGNNVTVDNNTINGVYYGIDLSNVNNGTTSSNITFSNNTIYSSNFGLGVRNLGTAKLQDIYIYDNHIYDSFEWDDPVGNSYHHDMIYAFNSDSDSGSILNLNIYNNLIDGNNGVYTSGWITLGGGVQGTGADQPKIYNNLLIDKDQAPAESYIWGRDRNTNLDQNALIANNVFYGYGAGNAMGHAQLSYGWHVINNIAIDVNNFIYENSFAECTYNILYSVNNVAQSTTDVCTGSDGMQIDVDPSLDAEYKSDASDDPAVDAGFNLSAYFTTDRAGATRPLGSAWDIGAYEYAGDDHNLGTFSGTGSFQ